MKNVLLIFVGILFLSSCKTETTIQSSKHPEGLIGINKTETGFNIYSNTGELILEYTKQNCDSLSLKTLDDIYYTAKEFYNKKSPEDKQGILVGINRNEEKCDPALHLVYIYVSFV